MLLFCCVCLFQKTCSKIVQSQIARENCANNASVVFAPDRDIDDTARLYEIILLWHTPNSSALLAVHVNYLESLDERVRIRCGVTAFVDVGPHLASLDRTIFNEEYDIVDMRNTESRMSADIR